ncbi:helix-turn-helix transcriptional regulator [Pseudomonas asplenii]|uniref:helix-turn-helix transcriptional regulator n=1 Tax=Pseudomonas asplenii TaxID=53407 RepID=UPI0002FE8401
MLKRAKSKPDPVKLSSADQAILQSHATLLDGLAAYLGAGFEFVLHRLDNLDASVIKIINGHLTGRQAGAPITDLALRMLAQINESQHSSAMNYFCRNRNGEPLKSTTLVIRGEQGTPIGLLCINFHLNTPLHEILGSFMQSPAGATEVLAENFGADVNETLSLALNTARKKRRRNDGVIVQRLQQGGDQPASRAGHVQAQGSRHPGRPGSGGFQEHGLFALAFRAGHRVLTLIEK